jgi:uncharacterized HAD superfamily protein
MRFGFDWDGTVTSYPEAFQAISKSLVLIIIITVNDVVHIYHVRQFLKLDDDKSIILEICPDNRLDDYFTWKTEKCIEHQVNLFFDDDLNVVRACKKHGIPALLVGEYYN